MNKLKHVEINLKDLKKSKEFYEKLLTHFGWKKILEEEIIVGWSSGEVDLFLVQTESKHLDQSFHRRKAGLNHLCFNANSQEEVDEFYQEYLIKNGISVLYGGPKGWPEYRGGYYAVYFEDPDRIKLEFAYVPA